MDRHQVHNERATLLWNHWTNRLGRAMSRTPFRRLLPGPLLMAVSLAVTCMSIDPGSASAAEGMSSPIVTHTLPGLVAEAPGPYNGPIDESNVDLLHLNTTQKSEFEQSIASGEVHAYLRVWTAEPPNGNGVLIAAFQFANPVEMTAFQSGFEGAVASSPGVTRFDAPGVPGGAGFALATTTALGGHGVNYVVGFAKGSSAFEVFTVNGNGALNSTDAVTVAQRQWAAVPNAAPATTTSAYRIGGIMGAVLLIVLLVGLIVILVQRRKKPAGPTPVVDLAHLPPPPNNRQLVAVGTRGARTFAPPSPYIAGYGPNEPGWVTDRSQIEQQVYWDGQAWTARRSYRSGEWVEE